MFPTKTSSYFIMLCSLSLTLQGCAKEDGANSGVDSDSVAIADSELADSEATDTNVACGPSTAGGLVTPSEPCTAYEVGAGPLRRRWSISGGGGQISTATPVVVDLDGDSTPEILLNVGSMSAVLGGTSGCELWAVSANGDILWKRSDADLSCGSMPAVADLDDDGTPEIFALRFASLGPLRPRVKLSILSNEGLELRVSSEAFSERDIDVDAQPGIADFDRDGIPELYAGRIVLDTDLVVIGRGTHGSGAGSWSTWAGGTSYIGGQGAVADVDLDGEAELIVGNARYRMDGSDAWFDGSLSDGQVAIANLDSDPRGEWVVSSAAGVRAHDDDGSLLWGPVFPKCDLPACSEDGVNPPPIPVNASFPSPVAIGDLNNDGLVEVVVAGGSELLALEGSSGRVSWAARIQDASGASAPTLADLDADGATEVIYADEVALRVLDGRTGRELRSADVTSLTWAEYPIVTDLDGDGFSEIVSAHPGDGQLLTVHEGAWAPTGRPWNQHAYSVSNILPNLAVPTVDADAFRLDNTYRAAPKLNMIDLETLPDLSLELVEACPVDCTKEDAQISFRAVNSAPYASTPTGVQISIREEGGDFVRTLTLEEEIEPASKSQILTVSIPGEVAERGHSFSISVDADLSRGGSIPECVETDNLLSVSGELCQR